MSHQDHRQNSIDEVLRKHLGRVPAPPQLWQRVRGSDKERASVQSGAAWAAWAATAAATVAVVAGGWALWQMRPEPARATASTENMAVAALSQGDAHLALRSHDATEVRKWVRDNAGIDLPLPPKHESAIQIIGANVSRNGVPVAEVAYWVDGYRASLMITKDPSGATVYPAHEMRASDPMESARVTSWRLKGQAYTLAFGSSGESRDACLLCHDQQSMTSPAMNKN